MDLLITAAVNAGVKGVTRNYSDENFDGDTRSCIVDYVVSDVGDATTTLFAMGESAKTLETSCFYEPTDNHQPATFHGYPARTYYYKGETDYVNDVAYTYEHRSIEWCMYKGERAYFLTVQTTTQSIEKFGPAQDPIPIADKLWSLAEDRLPLTPAAEEDAGSPAGPLEDAEVPMEEAELPGGEQEQPEVMVVPYGEGEEVVPDDAGSQSGTFEDAWQSREARGLRSAVLPLLGGLIGVGVSLIAGQGAARVAGVAGAVTARPVGAPPMIPPSKPPAVPPLPEEPPPLTAEELHTREMRKQGMIWSDSGGWQTPEQVRQSADWQANDRAAVKTEDAAWRRDYEKERLDLEQNRAEMEKAGKDLDAELKLTDLKLKMHQIQRELLGKHHYVFNPNHGIPVWNTITQARNYAMDTVFRTKGLTCEGYVDETKMRIKEAVKEIYGEDTVVETMKFDEKSSIMPRKGWFSPGAWKDWCDSFVTDNHVLTRITLPDKTELGADFHQYNARRRDEIIMPYEESRKVWKPYMGEHEFSETIYEKY